MYAGVCKQLGQRVELFDTEGTFGIKDNLGKVVKKIADALGGEKLHCMMCCISVEAISRVDLDTMKAVQICAGVVGEQNVSRLCIVWTFANDEAARNKADQCFDTIKEGINQIMNHNDTPQKKKDQMKPLHKLLHENKLRSVKVSKDDIGELVSCLRDFATLTPATVAPEEWTKDPEQVEEEMDLFGTIAGAIIDLLPMPAIFRPLANAAAQVVKEGARAITQACGGNLSFFGGKKQRKE